MDWTSFCLVVAMVGWTMKEDEDFKRRKSIV